MQFLIFVFIPLIICNEEVPKIKPNITCKELIYKSKSEEELTLNLKENFETNEIINVKK